MPWSHRTDTASEDDPGSSQTPSRLTPARPVVPPEDTVATVDGVPISKGDVQSRLEQLKTMVQGLGQEWKPLTQQELEGVVEQLISNELMSQDAVKRGLDRDTETQRRWDMIRREFFVQEWLRWNQQRLDVGDAEIEDAYATYQANFRLPERRKLRELVVSSEPQAKQALSQLLAGSVDFTALAQQISTGPTAAGGGLLSGWGVRSARRERVYGSPQAPAH